MRHDLTKRKAYTRRKHRAQTPYYAMRRTEELEAIEADLLAISRERKVPVIVMQKLLERGYCLSEIRAGGWKTVRGRTFYLPADLYDLRRMIAEERELVHGSHTADEVSRWRWDGRELIPPTARLEKADDAPIVERE